MKPNNEDIEEFEERSVLIIGNGPSAITLSFLLSGHWPYYGENAQHPVDIIHRRMSSIGSKSLIECDLSQLSRDLLGRTLNPVSVLFDQLQNPDSDLNAGLPSCLEWKSQPNKSIDHLVLGQGLPGGLWYQLRRSKTLFTVSRRLWMQLPNLAISAGPPSTTSSSHDSKRVSYRQIFDYYQRYIDKFGLANNFRNHTQVLKVEWDEENSRWVVDTICRRQLTESFENSKKIIHRDHHLAPAVKYVKVRYFARKVVLATGANAGTPSHLNISGEEHSFVMHSLSHFETVLYTERSLLSLPESYKPKLLLIVGSGLSAADALSMVGPNMKTIHVFRRSVNDRTMIFNQLSNEKLYPEYTRVHRRMKQSVKNARCVACVLNSPDVTYQAYQRCVLDAVTLTSNGMGLAKLHFLPLSPNCDGSTMSKCCQCGASLHSSTLNIPCDYVLVLIGSKPKLDFLQPPSLRNNLGRIGCTPIDIRHNPIRINGASHECVAAKHLYALGPLVGDSFVRFVQGGALAIAADLWQNQREHL